MNRRTAARSVLSVLLALDVLLRIATLRRSRGGATKDRRAFVADADDLPVVDAADDADAPGDGGHRGPAIPLPKPRETLHVALDDGDGQPVVLVHGVASSHLAWVNVLPLLQGRRIIAVDLLGFGDSPAPLSATFTLEEHVAYLERTLARLRLGDGFVLVGHSLGALIGARYAARHPHRVGGLVLVSPPVYLPPEAVGNPLDRRAMELYGRVYTYIRREKAFTMRHAARLAKIWPTEGGFEVTEQNWRPFALSLEHSIQTQTAIADVAAARQPVHLVYGTLDPVIVPGALHIIERMRHVTSHRIEGGDHAIRPRIAAAVADAVAAVTDAAQAPAGGLLRRRRR